jgi:hypothetical protein
MGLSSISIGRKLANEEGKARKITPIEGVPARVWAGSAPPPKARGRRGLS